MNKKRILCLIGQLRNGGTEKQLYLFLKNLDRDKFEPKVVVSGSSEGIWEQPIEELGIDIISLKASPVAYPFKFIKFKYLLFKYKPEIVFSWSFFTNIFSLVSGKIRFVGSLRGNLEISKDKLKPFFFKRCLKVDDFVVNSSLLKQQLTDEGIPYNMINVIFNIFEADGKNEKNDTRKFIRDKYQIPNDARVISIIARDTHEKDIPFFIETVKPIISRNKDVYALMIGSGAPAYRNDLEKEGFMDHIRMTGEVDNAKDLLSAADFYFLSSRFEGMPNVLLEAIDAGCAILTTDVGGVDDILQEVNKKLLDEIIINKRDPLLASEKLTNIINSKPLQEKIRKETLDSISKFNALNIMPLYNKLIS